MDSSAEDQQTQATQNVVDPRRLGQQNSGFSDEDISDIICLLVPYSECARQEVKRIAAKNSQHMVGRDDAGKLDLDYTAEDDPRNFLQAHQDVGEHHIALRFSAQVKNPMQGFTFGRNPNRCDICFADDPLRRLSNVHFRIYLNEWAVLMLEDQSTNGTIVDEAALKAKTTPPPKNTRRTLASGSKIKILMHQPAYDLVFLVRIPLRDGKYQAAYQRNLEEYMNNRERLGIIDEDKTIVPGPGGRVDLFKQRRQLTTRAPARKTQDPGPVTQPASGHLDGIPRAWNGSNKYNRVGEIGKGAFAVVYKVTSKFDGLPYAAKELDKRKFIKNGVLDQKVENEMKIMQKIKHSNIVQYVEHLDWDDRLLILIMEYVPGGDLGRLIADQGPLSESDTKTIARQLLDALGYLHEMNITHRDVKPDNILIASENPLVVKLTDFGLSKMVEDEQTFLKTFCGTLLYCAPEVYSEFADYDRLGQRHPRNRHQRANGGQRYDHAVDIWSLGGVLFYALTKKPPYPARNGSSYSQLLHSIMTQPLETSPLVEAGVSAEAIDFLLRMLDRRPETRASVEALQNHPWLARRANPSQLHDETSDEELQYTASQLSIHDNDDGLFPNDAELIPESDDEILDDEQPIDQEGQFGSHESEKENYTFGPGNQPQRLFGEVNVSALGSSGAIPAERLNLPLSRTDFGETEILSGQSEICDSFDSDDNLTPRERSQKSQKSQPQSGGDRSLRVSLLSANQSRSVDALNNMTFDAASQSLGGAESILEGLNMKSLGGSLLRSRTSDFNTSKRRASFDTSDEIGSPAAAVDRRVLKRLRSEVSADRLTDTSSNDDGDYELLAHIPSISRAQSGRQIDNPVHKSTFWSAQDRSSWHLRYPEMTQLQLDAFKAAATARGEDFAPGKSVLWDIAMKYFPPIHYEEITGQRSLADGSSRTTAAIAAGKAAVADESMPSTASGEPGEHEIPDTQPPEQRIIVPVKMDTSGKRIVGSLHSTPQSAVQNISVWVTESMASWGRAIENTRSYSPKTEAKVPKHAFKLMLWKPDYDPAKTIRPWNRPVDAKEEDMFYFYISTKATQGIYINGVHLISYDCKNPAGPCRYWQRLYHGDRVVVWQTSDGSMRTELTFSCIWGGSSKPRPSDLPAESAFVKETVARVLDEACIRAEKKMRSLSEHDLKMDEANDDVDERTRNIDRERDRSRAFELRRVEACRAIASRRNSHSPAPATYGTTAYSSEPATLTTQHSAWPSNVPPLSRGAVPTYRQASPGTMDYYRGKRS
ncbi:Serine/threonine-protein kinase RAD53 [Diplogelasinospora grovesii]|uniref:Autophagy-related protein 1 n=1 Tax=Diplogelasinospora grovesii TaxID=303347 RepID=A0AAN6RZC4_9PEZI|nr:Serine/threonine-protein kinase RAD53 [Diplogelasinospora grovesii]